MYLRSLDELLSGSFLVLFMSSPGPESRGLQGPAKGERYDPGFSQRAVADGIEVDRRLLFTLTPRQKSHSCETRNHCSHLVLYKLAHTHTHLSEILLLYL